MKQDWCFKGCYTQQEENETDAKNNPTKPKLKFELNFSVMYVHTEFQFKICKGDMRICTESKQFFFSRDVTEIIWSDLWHGSSYDICI